MRILDTCIVIDYENIILNLLANQLQYTTTERETSLNFIPPGMIRRTIGELSIYFRVNVLCILNVIYYSVKLRVSKNSWLVFVKMP